MGGSGGSFYVRPRGVRGVDRGVKGVAPKSDVDAASGEGGVRGSRRQGSGRGVRRGVAPMSARQPRISY